jgi:S-adenosylmethionine hydrolase
MAKRGIVTLLTDFGLADPYVAEMKGVILGIAPEVTLVDVTHQVPAGDVMAGAFVLRQSLPYFPAGTVHVVVVDPTVGTERRIIAARYAGQTVVFPDNGLITFVDRDQPLEQMVAVRNEQYFLAPGVSATFHGRDVMAPVAAHIARGLALDRLGPGPESFKLLDIPPPCEDVDGSLVGQVIYVDKFGNLISGISADVLNLVPGDETGPEIFCGGVSVGLLQTSYASAPIGEPVALINSMSLLEVAVNGGRACDVLSAGAGTAIRVARRGRQGGS